MEWKLTSTPIGCALQKTSIITERTEAVGSFCGWADERRKRKSDRRTSGWREGGARPVEISCRLVNASMKDKEGGPYRKYENKLMWKRWNGSWKEGSRGRKEEMALWWWVLSTLFCMAGWHRSMTLWLYLVEQVLGPKPLWIDRSERVSHTVLYNNDFPRSTGVPTLGPKTDRLIRHPGFEIWENLKLSFKLHASWLSLFSGRFGRLFYQMKDFVRNKKITACFPAVNCDISIIK